MRILNVIAAHVYETVKAHSNEAFSCINLKSPPVDFLFWQNAMFHRRSPNVMTLRTSSEEVKRYILQCNTFLYVY